MKPVITAFDFLEIIRAKPPRERWSYVERLAPEMSTAELAWITGAIWRSAGTPGYASSTVVQRLMAAGLGARKPMFRPNDWQTFTELPDPFLAYRGCCTKWNRAGYSWTLSKDVAERFVWRYNFGGIGITDTVEYHTHMPADVLARRDVGLLIRVERLGFITQRMIRKDDVLFYMNHDRAQEIVLAEPASGEIIEDRQHIIPHIAPRLDRLMLAPPPSMAHT